MDTSQPSELSLVETLYANGDTVHPGTLIIDETIGFHGARIGFHSDFRIITHGEARAYTVQQCLHCRAGKQAWRTTANKNGGDLPSLSHCHVFIQIG